MLRIIFIAAFTFLPLLSIAQQSDPIFLQKAIAVLQQQRNEAMDRAAIAEAKLAQANEELLKLKKAEPQKEQK